MEHIRVLEGSPAYIEADRTTIDSILDFKKPEAKKIKCLFSDLNNVELKIPIDTKDSRKFLKMIPENENLACLLLELKEYSREVLEHSYRVAAYSTALTELLGLNEDKRFTLYTGAMFHDIGKIALPKDLWSKKTKPTGHEAKLMRGHTLNGYNILKEISVPSASVALQHHERINSSYGYPFQLKGTGIYYNSKIVAVLDVFDVMSTRRNYSLVTYSLQTTCGFFDLYSKDGKKKIQVKDEKLDMLIEFFKDEQLFDTHITKEFLKTIPKDEKN